MAWGAYDEANYASDHGLPLPRGRPRRAGVGVRSGLVAVTRAVVMASISVCCPIIRGAGDRIDRPITVQPRGPGAHSWAQHSNKGPSFSAVSRDDDEKRAASCSPPASTARGTAARAGAHPLRKPRRGARPTMTDRRGGAAAGCAPRRRRRGLRRAGPHRGRGLARSRRRWGLRASLPRGLARARGTPRLGQRPWTPRLAQPRAPRGRLLPSCSRPPTATLTVTTQVPPQGRQEDLRQPTPDAHQGPGFTVSKTSKTPPAPEHAARRGKLLPPPPPPRLRLD